MLNYVTMPLSVFHWHRRTAYVLFLEANLLSELQRTASLEEMEKKKGIDLSSLLLKQKVSLSINRNIAQNKMSYMC